MAVVLRVIPEWETAAAAAKQLLERLADLYAWLPSLPDVALENPRLSEHARARCAEAMEVVRHLVFKIITWSLRDHCHRTAFRCVWSHTRKDPAVSVWADGGVCWHLLQGAPGGGLGKWGHTEPLMSGELVIQTTFPVPVTRART
ncbi:hypothetical protein QFW82_16785 [Streptomyces malaysiensis subsp. malaysiensis]|uniref:hypothetical protein n=1 Tax=Streptomyces malaysiensis TaxID=92644 RepID=UPI0024C0C35D|nr:hypothetical protein [Streptomyces sp. NA07423]WHX18591.1 hypothetical protein QFW82_16785 [Streptomyces sp. NA07423]